MSILLNSSKQHQAPDWAKPEKNRPIILKSNPSEQLNTTHCLARALAKSCVQNHTKDIELWLQNRTLLVRDEVYEYGWQQHHCDLVELTTKQQIL